jgi:hypothetical protein
MTTVSITSIILNKILYFYNADTRQNIYDYNNLYNIGSKGKLIRYKKDINFKYQIGGKTYEIKLDNEIKYEFYIDEIIPETNKKRRMCFMSNSYSYECLCVLFGTKESGDNKMRIESVLGSNECIKCDNKEKKIKAGDTLIQILLKIVKSNKKFAHIKKIELADTSKKSCYDIGIELLYLRTITHGIPYYAKFGFRPNNDDDYNIFKKNRNNFKLNKTITNNELIEIIETSKKKFNKDTYIIYKKYIEKYILNNKNINVQMFIIELIDIIDISLGKKEMIKENIFIGNKIIKNKESMKGICDLLNCICKTIYKKLEYEEYHSKIWILYL